MIHNVMSKVREHNGGLAKFGFILPKANVNLMRRKIDESACQELFSNPKFQHRIMLKNVAENIIQKLSV